MEKKSLIQKNDSRTIVGIIATVILGLYALTLVFTVAWAFAEIRERLKEYEESGLEPYEIKKLMIKLSEVSG